MNDMNRRDFVRLAAAAASLAATPALGRAQSASPNARIGIALIGCGGMGRMDLRDHLRIPEVDCLAVCDVDESHAAAAAQEVEQIRGRRPAEYGDFRRVLERADVAAVIVGTPDHWHALPTILACQAGKDVYVEKPLALSIGEGRRMVDAARKHGRVVQMGTQQRSAEHYRQAVDIVKAGELGKIRMARAWAYLDWKGELAPQPDGEPPAGVDYDMWLGPARQRPFNPNRFHFTFRWYWDYSGGLMTDWGAHMIDIVNFGMDVRAPRSAMAAGGKFGYPDDAMETPDTQQAVLEYDGFSVIWEHALGIGRGPWDREHGVEFHGNNGVLVIDRGGWEIHAETDKINRPERISRMESVPRQPASGDYHLAHVQNFIDCVRTRARPTSDVEIGHHSMKACHLANIALRVGRKIHWNDETEQILDDAEAQALVTARYRAPWALPEI